MTETPKLPWSEELERALREALPRLLAIAEHQHEQDGRGELPSLRAGNTPPATRGG